MEIAASPEMTIKDLVETKDLFRIPALAKAIGVSPNALQQRIYRCEKGDDKAALRDTEVKDLKAYLRKRLAFVLED